MSEERLNPNFNINAKYESMLENAKSIVENYLSHSDATCEPPAYINLVYDVKNYLPKLQQENQQLKEVIEEVRKYIEREDICIDIRDNELNYISTNELLQILDKGESNE